VAALSSRAPMSALKTLLFLPPAPERIRISGYRGVFTKLEYFDFKS
jgi:hypothetical protein